MKKLSKVLNESIWGKVLDRGAGETVRKEDKITTNKELKNKIQKLYKEQGEGETLDVSSLTNIIKCDDFSGIFEGYKRVKHIIGLEDWDVSHVKDMRSMFCDCKKFNSDLSKWDVSNVKDMRFMFQNCKKFNSDLSKWDVSNVEDMSFMFVNCGDFNYDLSNWDVSKVTDMKFMFQNCENFNSDLSKWDVSKVINMSYMFLYCINFNSDLSKWNVSKVTDMKYMFDDCKSLKKIPSWYMKRQSKITESIWGKILDRGAGETVRKEDDINLLDRDGLVNYLKQYYDFSDDSLIISEPMVDSILMTLFSINGKYYDITYNNITSNSPSIRFPICQSSNIEKLLNDNYKVKQYLNNIYEISSKDGRMITNSFFIEIVDFILYNLEDNLEVLLKKKERG